MHARVPFAFTIPRLTVPIYPVNELALTEA